MKNVESFYPLSPMQQGMLFHSLFEPHSGMYIELFSVKLKGALNLRVFEETWQWVANRHAILRTAFIWEGLKEPVQVVQEKVKLPFQVLDWRDLPAVEQDGQLEKFMKAERLDGFDLTRAPLMRLALIQTGDDEYHFIWTHHHILLDGWSIPLLLREVLVSYATFDQGRQPELVAARPFRDYVVWLKRQDLKESETYWRKKLAGFTAPTPLVVAKIDKAGLSVEPEFTEIEIYLPSVTSLALQNLARQQGLTLNTLMQGAWAILLSRYSGEEEVVFGTTVSGRPPDLPGSENMLGLFINTLPVRIAIPSDSKLLPWLKDLQIQQVEMRQYEYTPLVQIQGWSDVGRGVSLFDSILVFENFPLSGLGRDGTGGLEIQAGVSASHTNFPLTVVAAPGPQLSIKISYNRQLFDHATIERMLIHLQVLLEGMAAHPFEEISRLPLLSAREKVQLLEEWNVREARYPENRCIHEWVEEQADRSPEAIAVSFEGSCLSYRELNQRANALAHYLRSLGVGPESMVGIFMERNLDLIIAILGILKAGGAYVPLDPAYPVERLAFIVEDYSKAQADRVGQPETSVRCSVPALISQESMLASLPETSAQVVCIDRDWQHILEEAARAGGDPSFSINLRSGVRPGNLAYVIYTSGSTGKPKGCMITHANVVRLFEATDVWYRFTDQDVWTLFHSYAFDFSVWEIWGALFYGGRLVVVPYMVSRSPDLFYQLLSDEKVTVLNQTPSAFRQLVRAEEAAERHHELSLRLVIFGGEALELQSLKPWFDRHGDQNPLLVNMYGITETTVHVTYRPIYLSDLETAPGSVIGRAIPDLQVYILDQHFEPVPIGVPGELFVGGAGVARGYLNRPELTNGRFVKNLFGQPGEERVYRSGDLARYLPNGDIEYLGRIDLQVKIRGFRIELGEIESVLVQHPQVREAVVLAKEEDRHKRLVAYIVPKKDGPSLQVADLRQFISPILPDYMAPSAFVALESFPLTTNGKIDRKALFALDAPEEAKLSTGREYLPPHTLQEQSLAEIWASLLGVEKVGLLDNFFELGGDSILSIQLVSRAKQAGFQMTYRQLFEYPVLKDLAAALSAAGTLEEEQGLVIGAAPLTPIQRWFFEHHAGAPHHFNTSILFEMSQLLDIDLLKATLLRLLAHHDALRLSFHNVHGEWSQVDEDLAQELPFYEFDLVRIPVDEQSAWVEAKAAELQASFDLGRQPLLCMAYFHLGGSQPARLLIIFHHLVTDGVSIRIFMEDFQAVYLQLLAGVDVVLPRKTTSYAAWARMLQEYGQSLDLKRELPYWMRVCEAHAGGLPMDVPTGENTYGSTQAVTLSLSVEDTQVLLHDLPAASGARMQDALLTALAHWYRGLTGQRSVILEMEGHGREQVLGTVLEDADCSRTIGWFTSIFPFRLDLDGSGGLRQELMAVRRDLEAVPNRGVGFGVLRYLTQDEELHDQISRLPQPQINFNYLGLFDQAGSEVGRLQSDQSDSPGETNQAAPFRIARESAGPEQNTRNSKSAVIYLVALVNGGQLSLRWLYSTGLHSSDTIRRWANEYLAQLQNIVQSVRDNQL